MVHRLLTNGWIENTTAIKLKVIGINSNGNRTNIGNGILKVIFESYFGPTN
jgi:hypothetical protein